MLEPIVIRAGIVVPADAMSFHAVRASGPGGQNVNKVSSKVDLRVDLGAIIGLAPDARGRLAALCAHSLDADGHLVVVSQVTRDQRRNLQDARARVRSLIEQALVRPRTRRKTRPTRGSVERRLTDKRHRAQTKSGRRGDD